MIGRLFPFVGMTWLRSFSVLARALCEGSWNAPMWPFPITVHNGGQEKNEALG